MFLLCEEDNRLWEIGENDEKLMKCRLMTVSAFLIEIINIKFGFFKFVRIFFGMNRNERLKFWSYAPTREITKYAFC